MKYIDVEKLKEILLPSYEEAKKESLSTTDAVKWEKVEYIFDFVFHLIDSIQQDETQVYKMLCSQVWWEEQGWIMIPPDATVEGIESLLKQVRKKLQQEPTPDTDALHTELINLLKKYRIGEETARTIADRIADTYGAQRYMDGLCDGLNKEDTKKEQPEVDLVAEIKVVYPCNPKRKEIGFYYNKKEVSWEDMLLADRMHDYPYYFRDGMDYYPFIPEQEPAKKDDIGYDLGRGKGMETHEKSWNTVIMTLEEAITHCKEKACGNTQCALEHRQLAEWLEELKEYRKNAIKEQPEVDLDFQVFAKEMDAVFNLPKEVTENTEENPMNWEYAIARHFYELGLNARNL